MTLKMFILSVIIPLYIFFVLRKAREIHPKGLFVLFFTEMWERMSYYGMRALLVLYMTQYLLNDPARFQEIIGLGMLKSIFEMGMGEALDIQPYSSKIYGLYTGIVYLSPFFGGILADRVWGRRKSVYIGGFLMAIGHFLMAFENLFLPALFFLIMGNGCFKPNISSQVGNLYPKGDNKKDGAYTLFYMGVNLGAFYSPFLCRDVALFITEKLELTGPGIAWHIGFSLAGVGMLLGLLIYHLMRKHIPVEPDVATPPAEKMKITYATIFAFLFTVAVFISFSMIPTVIQVALAIIGGFLVYTALKKIEDPDDRAKVGAIIFITVPTIAFWMIFEQQGNTLQLWADEKANWGSLGLESTTYQSFNPAFIFLFAPILDRLWASQVKNGKGISSVAKMARGCFIAGVAFLVLAIGSQFITEDKSTLNLMWLALGTWIFTMGELYVSPIGLSFVNKVSPKRFLSMMMGVFYLSAAIGNNLAGSVGALYSKMSNGAFFLIFAVLGMAVGLLFLTAEKRLTKIVGPDV